jgi:ABC-type polysaccharide transport system permease subunit
MVFLFLFLFYSVPLYCMTILFQDLGLGLTHEESRGSGARKLRYLR